MANEHSSSSDGKWGREIREAEAKEKSNATTPPTTPSDAAMRAAKEIAFRINGGEDDENLSYPKALSDLMDNPSIANEQAFASWLAAIITRRFPQSPAAALSDLFALFERDKAGRWNFLSLSRDDSKFDAVMDRLFAAATTSPETPVGGEAFIRKVAALPCARVDGDECAFFEKEVANYCASCHAKELLEATSDDGGDSR